MAKAGRRQPRFSGPISGPHSTETRDDWPTIEVRRGLPLTSEAHERIRQRVQWAYGWYQTRAGFETITRARFINDAGRLAADLHRSREKIEATEGAFDTAARRALIASGSEQAGWEWDQARADALDALDRMERALACAPSAPDDVKLAAEVRARELLILELAEVLRFEDVPTTAYVGKHGPTPLIALLKFLGVDQHHNSEEAFIRDVRRILTSEDDPALCELRRSVRRALKKRG